MTEKASKKDIYYRYKSYSDYPLRYDAFNDEMEFKKRKEIKSRHSLKMEPFLVRSIVKSSILFPSKTFWRNKKDT